MCDFFHTEDLKIDFPVEEDEDEIPEDAQHLILEFLCHNPVYRLGSSSRGGVAGVKGHAFFDLNWRNLLRQKAEFIPQMQGDEDTSYFDSQYMCITLYTM